MVDVDLHDGDFLEVYDGDPGEATKIVHYMGSSQGDVIFSTRNTVTLYLTTDLTDTGRGFNLTYQSGSEYFTFTDSQFSQPVKGNNLTKKTTDT